MARRYVKITPIQALGGDVKFTNRLFNLEDVGGASFLTWSTRGLFFEDITGVTATDYTVGVGQRWTFTSTNMVLVDSHTYSLTIEAYGDAYVPDALTYNKTYYYTSDGTATVAEVSEGFKDLINADVITGQGGFHTIVATSTATSVRLIGGAGGRDGRFTFTVHGGLLGTPASPTTNVSTSYVAPSGTATELEAHGIALDPAPSLNEYNKTTIKYYEKARSQRVGGQYILVESYVTAYYDSNVATHSANLKAELAKLAAGTFTPAAEYRKVDTI